MQNSPETNSGIRPGVLLTIVAVIGIVLGAIVFRKKVPAAPETVVADAQPPIESPAPAMIPPRPPVARPSPPPPPATVPVPAPTASQAVPGGATTPTPAVEAINDWEKRIDGILGDDQTDEAKKADVLLALFPSLPEDGQIEAAQHISNLLPDERYSSLAPMFTNALSGEHVLEVLLTDLLNRPDALKLPTLLEVARLPDHPKAGEARDILEVFTDENFGTDWAKWEGAVQKYLKENQEPPEPQ